MQSINADRTQTIRVSAADLEWVSSPTPGVWRKMLEREGGEVARATTIVRYALDTYLPLLTMKNLRFEPNQSFPAHTHGGGEEFLVLDGVWRDDYGVFPALNYIRNYIGSSHTPVIGPEGCTILVKLRQMSHECKESLHQAWDASGILDSTEVHF